MLQRMIGVLKLDAATFEEIEHDQSATGIAAIIVVLVGLLNGIGRKVNADIAVDQLDEGLGELDQLEGLEGLGTEGLEGLQGLQEIFTQATEISWAGALLSGVVTALVGWLAWAVVTNFIGRYMGGKSDTSEMMRVLGFANIPLFIGAIPILACLTGLVAWVWSIAAGFVAVRQGLDLDNGKAAIVIILSIIPAGILKWVINSAFGIFM